MKTPETPKRGFSTAQASHYLGVSESLLRQSRMNGEREDRIDGPRWVTLGKRKIIYYLEDLDAWLDMQKAISTGQEAS